MPKRKTTAGEDAGAPLSLRLGPELLAKIEAARAAYMKVMSPSGFAAGPAITRAEVTRWAIEEGLRAWPKYLNRISRKGGRK